MLFGAAYTSIMVGPVPPVLALGAVPAVIALGLWIGQANPKMQPSLMLRLLILSGLFVALCAVLAIDLPGPLEDALPGGWPRIALAILAALTATVVGMTCYATAALARNYPDVTDIQHVFDCRRDIRRPVGTEAAVRLWDEMLEELTKECDPAIPDALADRYPPIRVSPGAPAKGLHSTIETLVQPVMIFMLAVIALLTLGFDVLETGLAETDAGVAEAGDKAAEAYGLMVGAAFTIALGLVYVQPVARLAVYYPDEDEATPKAAGAPDRGWTARIDARMGSLLNGARISADPVIAPPAAKPDAATEACSRIQADHIGADRTKFVALLERADYGAGFHDALKDTATGKLKQALMLFAPALSSGLLALLGWAWQGGIR